MVQLQLATGVSLLVFFGGFLVSASDSGSSSSLLARADLAAGELDGAGLVVSGGDTLLVFFGGFLVSASDSVDTFTPS